MKTSSPVRGTASEQKIRRTVRVLREVANWIEPQPQAVRSLRFGAGMVTIGEVLTACRSVSEILNEDFTGPEQPT